MYTKTFRVFPSHREVALLLTLFAASNAFGETFYTQIGDPVFKPAFAAGTTSWQYSADVEGQRQEVIRITQELVGDLYLAHDDIEKKFGIWLPGTPHEGPYDLHSRKLLAQYGIVNTDVLLAKDIRGSETQFGLRTLVPIDDSRTGASPDGDNGPVIPNDIFPITVTRERTTRNGTTIIGRDSWQIQSLEELGEVADINGGLHDFTGLQHSHLLSAHSFGTGPDHPWNAIPGDFEMHLTFIDKSGNGWKTVDELEVVRRATGVAGDLSYNGQLDMHDLNILTQNVVVAPAEPHGEFLARLDLNGDETIDLSDVNHWVTELKSTWIGDANLDGVFDSGDFVDVFGAGKYESGELARWSEGDWNTDEVFDSGDFIAAFQDGGYEMGARSAVATVPEPSGLLMLLFSILGIGRIRTR